MTEKDEFAEDEELLAQMRVDFLAESGDIIDQLAENIVALEKRPDDAELINEVFRAAHTIKGSAAFVSLNQMRELAHKLEDAFSLVRDGSVKAKPEFIDIASEAISMLALLREDALAGAERPRDLKAIFEKLAALTEESGRERPTKNNERQPAAPVDRRAEKTSETLRVSSERLDALIAWVSELVTVKNQLVEEGKRLADEPLAETASGLSRVSSEIQAIATGLRLVPLETLFRKFPSLVRTLARELGKEVELKIEGTKTEVDKGISEKLYDPLVHILRNSVDHGIEEADTRRQKGKSVTGSVTIDAKRAHNAVEITISDDGAGLDYDALRRVAVTRGLATPVQADKLSDDELAELVFLPGFSTSATVSDVSGRGVGMDVVRANLAELRGSVFLTSEWGRGSTAHLKIPVTLAISQVLFVEAGGQTFGLPLEAVAETTVLDKKAINTFGGYPSFFYRDQALMLCSLAQLLDAGAPRSFEPLAPTVIVNLGNVSAGLAVDSLAGKQEVVIKDFGPYLGSVPGAIGGAIGADGSVIVILDIVALLRSYPGFAVAVAGKKETMKQEQTVIAAPAGEPFIVFAVDGVECAMLAEPILEIVTPERIDPVPEYRDCVAGVIDFHNQPVIVTDLGCRLDPSRHTPSAKPTVIVFRGPRRPIGLAVESVSGIEELPAMCREAPPVAVMSTYGRWLKNIVYQGSRAIMVLDETMVLDADALTGVAAASDPSVENSPRFRKAG